MSKPYGGMLIPRNTLRRGQETNPESRELRNGQGRSSRRLMIEGKSPHWRPQEPPGSVRLNSPKRPRRETRSTSTLDNSPELFDRDFEDSEDDDLLDRSLVSQRPKRRRTELNATGGFSSNRTARQRSPRLEEVHRVENMMDSSEYAQWSRSRKMKDQLRDAESNRAPESMDQYPDDIVKTKKLNLPGSKTQQRQVPAREVSIKSTRGVLVEFGLSRMYDNGVARSFDKIVLHNDGGTSRLGFREPESEHSHFLNVDKVHKVIASSSQAGTRLRLLCYLARDTGPLDLEMKDSIGLQHLAAALSSHKNIKVQEKSEEWLRRAQENTEGQERTFHPTLDVELAESNQRSREGARRLPLDAAPELRPKLSTRLQGDHIGDRETRRNETPVMSMGTETHPPLSTRRRVTRSLSGAATVSNVAEEHRPRYLRSEEVESGDNAAALMAARPTDFGPRWKKPLVFPQDGKKRATVDYDDLLRLDDGEFFNDNIIGFYLRYLMHQLENSHGGEGERIYWFNSYFFEKLTGPPKPRGGINYDAVKRWTRDVDIFKYDYVVVPVNENAHWYLILICNLPRLFRIEIPDDEETKVPGSSPHHPIGIEESQEMKDPLASEPQDVPSREILDEWVEGPVASEYNGGVSSDLVIGVPASPDEKDPIELGAASVKHAVNAIDHRNPLAERKVLSDITGLVYESTSTRPRASQRKKKRPSIRQYDPSTPAVITLDSLGISHPETTRAIKQYLVAEAEDKKGNVPFDESGLQGMNAKGIPQQDNWCDCGPYLLGYMDEFTRDPKAFVNKLLRREFDEKRDWRNDLRPSHMRANIRHLILELYRSQQSGKKRSKKAALPLASDPVNAEDLVDEPSKGRPTAVDSTYDQPDIGRNILKSSIEETSATRANAINHDLPPRTVTNAFRKTSPIDPTVIPDSQEGVLSDHRIPEPMQSVQSTKSGDQMRDDLASSSPPSIEEQLRRAASPGEIQTSEYFLLDDA